MALTRWRVAGLALGLGALAALGQAPWGLWFVSLPALAGLIWLFTQSDTARRAAWTGWCSGTGYFGVSLFWIVEPFLVDIARHGWMAPFALFFVATGFALFFGAAFWLAWRIFGQGRLGVAGLVLVWTFMDVLRGLILTGFPWAMVGHIWLDSPVLQLAAFGGAPLLTFLALALAAAPFALPRILGIAVSAAVLAGAWAWGGAQLQGEVALSGKTVRIIQPNAQQHEKWDPDNIPLIFQRQIAMTVQAADAPLDLILWPETSLAWRIDRAEEALAEMARAAKGAPIVFGANSLVDDTYRNTALVLDGQGEIAQTYYKHHLVPFGEYVPLGELAAKVGINGMAARDGAGYSAGPGPQVLDIPGLGAALPLICYELIFARHLIVDERPEVILQITNDAWFGNISGPYQHLAQARLRAVEQGLPVLRSANTGVSAVIGPRGKFLHQMPLNEAGYMDRAIPAALPPTLYNRLGDIPFWVALAMLLASLIIARRAKGD